MPILVDEAPVDALSMLVHRARAESRGAMCEKLKELIPQPPLSKIPIQPP